MMRASGVRFIAICVMVGLDPAIYVVVSPTRPGAVRAAREQRLDGRVKPSHDDRRRMARRS